MNAFCARSPPRMLQVDKGRTRSNKKTHVRSRSPKLARKKPSLEVVIMQSVKDVAEKGKYIKRVQCCVTWSLYHVSKLKTTVCARHCLKGRKHSLQFTYTLPLFSSSESTKNAKKKKEKTGKYTGRHTQSANHNILSDMPGGEMITRSAVLRRKVSHMLCLREQSQHIRPSMFAPCLAMTYLSSKFT